MRTWKNKQGFTLVELLVTIAVASIVTFAAVTFLLLGIRMNQANSETVKEQNNTRVILSMVEKLAGNGEITGVEIVDGDWALNAGEDILLQYSVSAQSLLTGAGAELLTGVQSSTVTWDANNSLLTLTVDDYETAVYCRTVKSDITTKYDSQEDADKLAADEVQENKTNLANTVDGRMELLQTLISQYGSEGQIKGENKYYSEWYIDNYQDHPGWDENTPWCACFLSWACSEISERNTYLKTIPHFANVDDGAKKFKNITYGTWVEKVSNKKPNPGDFIFFNWDADGSLDHVGCVLGVKDGVVYTIEGNSGGKVAMHRYSTNSGYIAGYGVLDWK